MPSTLSLTTTLPLPNSKHTIPQLGFGVFESPPQTCVSSCLTALRAGYRHIDTAQYYANESAVGHAVRDSNIPRSELFLTTKILFPGQDAASTYRKIEDSVRKLGGGGDGGYVDLFLIHSPNGGRESRRVMWEALGRAKEAGLVREIGVSNFGVGHLEEVRGVGVGGLPAVNQIELHPWCQQREVVEYCRKNGMVVEAYCPIVRNQKADDRTVKGIAEKHQVSPNQVLIRYALEKGWVPLPKSDTPERIKKNADVYGFKLDGEDMKALDGLDQGKDGAIVQAVDNSPQ